MLSPSPAEKKEQQAALKEAKRVQAEGNAKKKQAKKDQENQSQNFSYLVINILTSSSRPSQADQRQATATN
jgi:hypothetical protein